MNPNLDPMIYPLLFPRGELGWSPELQHVQEHRTAVRNKITQLEFYSYKVAIKPSFSPIHHAGKLFQQYLFDAYCKVEAARLQFIAQNQSQLGLNLIKDCLIMCKIERLSEICHQGGQSFYHQVSMVVLAICFRIFKTPWLL